MAKDENYLERAAAKRDNFLAAEIVDGQIRCTWPNDPLVAQRLFIELDYQFKLAHIEGAAKLRMQAEEMADKAKALVQPADVITLNTIERRAKHGRS